jgi:hypothetical protein
MSFAGEPDEGVPIRTVVKPIAYIDAQELEEILSILDVEWVVKPSLNVVFLRGPIERIEGALMAIDAVDQPVAKVRVTVFIVEASRESRQADAEILPDELNSAIDQLRGLFGYESFELLDITSLLTLHGRGGTMSGGLVTNDTGKAERYSIEFDSVRVLPLDDRPGATPGINFNNFVFSFPSPRLKTDVEIFEGQKAVIGRSTAGDTGKNLILIVEAKIEE